MAEHGSRGGCCRCCCSFILTSGFAALFMWLSLRGSNPKCLIQGFSVPALNITDKSTSTRTNHTLSFELKLENTMKDKGVYYDDIFLTFYGPNTSSLIGNFTLPGFYQGHGKTARREEVVETHGVPWGAVYNVVSNGSSVVFRVDLRTKVRYRILFFNTKRHGLVVGANVDVSSSGEKVAKKGIKLKSLAPRKQGYFVLVSLSILFVHCLCCCNIQNV